MTIFILTLLMVLEGPKLVDGALNLVSDRQRRERIHQVAAGSGKSITGYISGNLLISAICGGLIYAVLKIMGVPFAGLIAIFVAFADLIPLVGATLGAIVAGDRGSFSLHSSTHRGRHLLCGGISSWRTMFCNHSSRPGGQTRSADSDCGDPGWG